MLDHLRRGTLELGGVKQLVLDEADQMRMGFLDEVEALMHALPYRRQTMLFSATMPAGVKRLAGNYMKDPVDIVIKGLPDSAGADPAGCGRVYRPFQAGCPARDD